MTLAAALLRLTVASMIAVCGKGNGETGRTVDEHGDPGEGRAFRLQPASPMRSAQDMIVSISTESTIPTAQMTASLRSDRDRFPRASRGEAV